MPASNAKIHVYNWSIENPKSIVHIIHGMSEHAARYQHFGRALNQAGFGVVASDLRGHGKTAGEIDDIGFFAKADGWNLVTQDCISLTKSIKNDYPNVPVIILGHSMGSFVARTIAFNEPSLADGYVLSGTVGDAGWKGTMGKPMAKLLAIIFGKKSRSKFLTNMTFSGWNKRIEEKRTHRDWLTRDSEVVDKYINDPYCSQNFSNQFFYDLASGVSEMNKLENIRKVNLNTPVLIVSGAMDPAGNYGKGPKEIFEKYKSVGVKKIEIKLFDDGRHEIINETNREEIYSFIINWLDNV